MKNRIEQLSNLLDELFEIAESIVTNEVKWEIDAATHPHRAAAWHLAKIKHAFRGAAITLLAYKVVNPTQDIRAHKDEYPGGFSARTYDSKATIPFLIKNSLPRSVETHWLTQTISFAPALHKEVILKTQPKKAGNLLVEVVNYGQDLDSDSIREMVIIILVELIKIRNQDKVIMTRPKRLSIDSVKQIISDHFERGYKNNAPRLPQLAIYAIYQSILDKMTRFNGQTLEPIQRMKSADRKTGTVGDIVVIDVDGNPIEAVEIKFAKCISYVDVCEAIEKVRGASVSRYYMLSTAGIGEDDIDLIKQKKFEFLKQNGCEIIVNGVVETIGYYLRLLPNTTEFLAAYVELVEHDEDTAYEHRIAWNEICREI